MNTETKATVTPPTVKPAAEPTPRAAPLDAAVAATPDRRQSILQVSAAFLGIAPNAIYAALRGIWTTSQDQAPLSDGEIWRGLAIVARYELDPFAREIYVSRDKKGNPMIIIGLDGWIKILDRTDHYDGMDVMIFHEDDDPDKPATRVETTIYSKKRKHPARYMAYASEYAKLAGYMHAKIPLHMLRIFSFRHAARLFIPLGCVVTEEEARWMGASTDEPDPVNSLDELTEKLKGKQDAETDRAMADVRADQAKLADEYAGEFAVLTQAYQVAELELAMGVDARAGKLTAEQTASLQELIESAKTRLSQTE